MSRPTVIYSLPKLHAIGSCVYKLSFNEKYLIIKAKDHLASIQTMQKSLNQFMRNSELQRKPDNLYFHFFSYIEKAKEGEFKTEILLETDNQYDLLKEEQLQLDKGIKDKNCMNNSMQAYIPLYNEETGHFGWITRGAVLNFKKWLKNRKKQLQ